MLRTTVLLAVGFTMCLTAAQAQDRKPKAGATTGLAYAVASSEPAKRLPKATGASLHTSHAQTPGQRRARASAWSLVGAASKPCARATSDCAQLALGD